MNALRPRNFPYILCSTVFKKSLSLEIEVSPSPFQFILILFYLGSSESKSSSSWRTNFWSMTFFPIDGWKSGDSRNLRKNSYTSWKITRYIINSLRFLLYTVKWGQEASKVGSSSSGSKSGLSLGGNVRNRLQAI